MKWTSFADFINMGGQGGYVWPAFGLTVVFLIVEIFLIFKRRKNAFQQLKQFVNLQRVQENESQA